MKHKWNDALAAYERDYDLIEEVRASHIELLGELIEQVATRVRRQAGFELKVTRQEHEATHLAELNVGDAVAVYVWPSRPSGGPAGLIRIGIYLMNAYAAREAMPDELSVMSAETEVVLGALARDEQPKGDDLSDDESLLLAVRSFELATDDVVDALSTATFAYCRAAGELAQVLAKLEGSTPLLWMRQVLGEMLEIGELDKALEAGGVCQQRKLSKWPTERDRYFPIAAEGIESLWLMTQTPGGRLGFCLNKRSASMRALQETMCQRLGAEPLNFNGYRGGELLSDERIAALHREQDSAPLIARIAETWKTYAEVVGHES